MKYLEEMRGFEPRKRLYIVYFFSREAPSTARPHFLKLRVAPLRTLSGLATCRIGKPASFGSPEKLFAYDYKPVYNILGGSTIYTLTRLPSSHEFQHLFGSVTILWGSASRSRLIYPNYLALSLYHLACGCLSRKHCWERKPKKTLVLLLNPSVFRYTLAFNVIAHGQASSRLCFTSYFALELGLTASYTKRFLLLRSVYTYH